MNRSLLALASAALLFGCPTEPGPRGDEGPAGPQGATGAQGPVGPQGPEGPQGPPGDVTVLDGGTVVGPQGARGASVVVTMLPAGVPCAAGGVRVSLEDGGAPQVICNGTPGAMGAMGPAGAAGPTGAPGASVTVVSLDGGAACPSGGVRVWVDGGAPAFVCNGAVGPQGGVGAQGPAGPAGAAGAQGVQGVAGPAGPQGPAGPAGAVGAQGTQGATGATGPAGPQGAVGAQGPAGLSVTVTPVLAGDANCPYGGSRLVVGSSTSWACNGAPGPSGPPGSGGSGGDGGVGSAGAGNEGYSFAGFTVATFTGDLGGIQGAHAKCAAEFDGAHFCTDREYEVVGSSLPIPTGGAWIDFARYISSSSPSATPRDRERDYSCGNWKVTTGAYSGALEVTGDYVRTTLSTACSTMRPLACCRAPQSAWFRGFTTQAFSGDLGGIRGAHAKCAAQYAGSHFCTDREYENAASPMPVPAGGAWIDFARYISTSTPSATPRDRERDYSCANWKVTSGAYSGALEVSGSYIRTTLSTACATLRPLACCSN